MSADDATDHCHVIGIIEVFYVFYFTSTYNVTESLLFDACD